MSFKILKKKKGAVIIRDMYEYKAPGNAVPKDPHSYNNYLRGAYKKGQIDKQTKDMYMNSTKIGPPLEVTVTQAESRQLKWVNIGGLSADWPMHRLNALAKKLHNLVKTNNKLKLRPLTAEEEKERERLSKLIKLAA